jgi:hypothetical protein
MLTDSFPLFRRRGFEVRLEFSEALQPIGELQSVHLSPTQSPVFTPALVHGKPSITSHSITAEALKASGPRVGSSHIFRIYRQASIFDICAFFLLTPRYNPEPVEMAA